MSLQTEKKTSITSVAGESGELGGDSSPCGSPVKQAQSVCLAAPIKLYSVEMKVCSGGSNLILASRQQQQTHP